MRRLRHQLRTVCYAVAAITASLATAPGTDPNHSVAGLVLAATLTAATLRNERKA